MLFVNGEPLKVKPGQTLFAALLADDNWCERDIVDENGKCFRCGQELCVCPAPTEAF